MKINHSTKINSNVKNIGTTVARVLARHYGYAAPSTKMFTDIAEGYNKDHFTYNGKEYEIRCGCFKVGITIDRKFTVRFGHEEWDDVSLAHADMNLECKRAKEIPVQYRKFFSTCYGGNADPTHRYKLNGSNMYFTVCDFVENVGRAKNAAIEKLGREEAEARLAEFREVCEELGFDSDACYNEGNYGFNGENFISIDYACSCRGE